MIYKIAIIGAGAISAKHLEAIQQMDQLQAVGIADINQERAEAVALEYSMNAYVDYKEMIASEKPNIVVITLPHYLHREAAIFCANAGCHILLEKPMALNTQECDEIMLAVERNNIRLMVGHTVHYFSENRKAYEVIRKGELGELVMINDARHVPYYKPERPDWFFDKKKSGGGILMNLGSHSIDKIQWLTDSVIRNVKSSMSYYGNKGDVEGSCTLFMITSKEVPVTISLSGYGGVDKNETEFIFTKGMLKLSDGFLWVSERGEYKKVETGEKLHPFVLQFQDLLNSIENHTELECSAEYGRSVVSVVETIYSFSERE